ncbi:MAG TPA: hypothetical protein VGE74_06345, partial [Gemmata sp.]
KKEDEGLPGKRTAHRQGARLKRFYVAKGGTLPVTPAAPAPAAVPAEAAKSDAKKDAKDKKTAPKGSGK